MRISHSSKKIKLVWQGFKLITICHNFHLLTVCMNAKSAQQANSLFESSIAQWKTELALYKNTSASGDHERTEISRENHMLKLQLDEMRNMLDVTVSKTQEECHDYLHTIDMLKQQVMVQCDRLCGKFR